MTKKSADINYISRDLFPKTYNRTMIDDDYIKQLEQENQSLKDIMKKAIEILECSENIFAQRALQILKENKQC